jgi:capsid protein
MGFFSWLVGRGAKSAPIEYTITPALPAKRTVDAVVPLDSNGFAFSAWDGDKFEGGFGITQDRAVDYWTLRTRSARIYDENMYAYSLVQRLTHNIIANGLTPESEPITKVLGWSDEQAATFRLELEQQFSVWANAPWLCDSKEERTFGQLQQEIFSESYIEGDVLVVLKWNNRQNLPRIDIIGGRSVQSPLTVNIPDGHTMCEGVERDSRGRHVAYWIYKSGRRLAFLYYAPGKRSEDVRGMPLLARALQSLKEIDSYSAALQRKAVINSMVAMTIERDVESTAPVKGVAMTHAMNGPTQVEATTPTGTKAGAKFQGAMPGTIVDQMPAGWKLRAHQGSAAMEPFAQFANSHLKPIAFSNGLAPEVYMMEFNKSFSAAQAANNEQRLETSIERGRHGTPMDIIFEEVVVALVLNGKVNAPGFLEALSDSKLYDKRQAYLNHRWSGYVKPVVDLAKVVPAHIELLDNCLTTSDRVCQELHGMDFDEVVSRRKQEIIKIADALKPLVELGLLGKGAAAAPAPDADKSTNTPAQ